MSTVRDYKYFADKRSRAAQRAAQDRHMATLHRQFDLSAQDTHMKYERPSFAVVTASEAYRDGWDRIFAPKVDDSILEQSPAEGPRTQE